MEDNEIKNIWKNQDRKIEDIMNLNISVMKEMKTDKAKSKLKGLLIRRAIEAASFMISIVLLMSFGFNNPAPQYFVSAFALGVFAIIGFFGSIFQIVSISRIDYAGSITEIQEELERLKIYSLQTFKLIILSAPFYMAYVVIGFKVFLEFDIYTHGNSNWLLSQALVSALILIATIWFYSKLSYKTTTKWIKKAIRDNGGKQIHSAMEFLNDIETFKKEVA